jgi:PD-(D/E)XK nuclease superfamily
MAQTTYDKNITFLEGFKLLENSKISETKQAFEVLFKGFRPLYAEYQDNIKTNTPDYNIFEVLRISRKEGLHSRFLADLLNVEGAHQQGCLFYNAFFKQISQINPNFDSELYQIEKENFWAFNIKCEYSITEKRLIDILLQYNDGKKQFAIAIENKVGANDQPNQLQDYNAFLEQNYRKNYLLLYLTIDGKEPSTDIKPQDNGTYSISNEKYYELKKNNHLLLISHRNHIKMMLEKTIPSIQSPIFKPILSNYYHILSIL